MLSRMRLLKFEGLPDNCVQPIGVTYDAPPLIYLLRGFCNIGIITAFEAPVYPFWGFATLGVDKDTIGYSEDMLRE
jgi:hypothetical protein